MMRREADFFRIKCWNSQAEAVAENLVKGRRIAVEGSLRQDTLSSGVPVALTIRPCSKVSDTFSKVTPSTRDGALQECQVECL
jgi:hypothetical protein